ncbi:MAG: hypothetical protein ABID38_06300 [Candidatus Diapherotrites archaeon]
MKKAVLAGVFIILFLIAGCTDTENPEAECTEELCAEFMPGPPTLEECEESLEVMIAKDEFHLKEMIWEKRVDVIDKFKANMLISVYTWATSGNVYLTNPEKNWDEEIDLYFKSMYGVGVPGSSQFANRVANHLAALWSIENEGNVKISSEFGPNDGLSDLISETLDEQYLEGSFFKFADPDCGPNNPTACYAGYYIIIDVTKMDQGRLMELASITAEDRISGKTVKEGALPNERIEILILDPTIVEIAKEK